MVETVSVSLHVCLFLFLHTNTQFFVCLFGFLRIKCLPLGIWDRTRYWGSRWLRHVTACKSSWPSGNANVKKVSSLLSYCLFTPNSCFWYVRVVNWSMAPDSSFCYPNWCFCIQLCDTGAESLQNTLLPFSWFPVRFWLLGVLENKKGLIPSFPTPCPLGGFQRAPCLLPVPETCFLSASPQPSSAQQCVCPFPQQHLNPVNACF